jgi:beta-glucosidase
MIVSVTIVGGNDNSDESMNARRLLLAFSMLATGFAWTQQYQYPFQNPNLPVEARINNILSLMTLDEKISALSTNPDVPRLGIQGSKHIEGLHGVAYGGPGGW